MFKYNLIYGDDSSEIIESPFYLKEGDEFSYKEELFFVTDKSNNCHKVNLDYQYSIKKLKYYFEQNGYKWEDTFTEEKILQELFMKRLSNYFEFDTEVWGTHQSGKRIRIDAIIKSTKTPLINEDKKFPLTKHIGIEFKNPMNIGKSTGRNYYDVFAQCVDYSQTNFDNYGQIIVLTCPLFKTPALSSLVYFLKEFNVGNVSIIGNSISFKWGEMLIWSEGTGFTTQALKNKFTSKTGTRA